MLLLNPKNRLSQTGKARYYSRFSVFISIGRIFIRTTLSPQLSEPSLPFKIIVINISQLAHPVSPGEGETEEHTNGTLCQYFLKGTDFTKISFETIQQVYPKLNDCPKAVLGCLNQMKLLIIR